MEKLTRVLAIVEGIDEGAIVLDKAVMLARHFGASVELLLADWAHTQAFGAMCALKGYDEVTLSSVHRGFEPLGETLLRRVLETRPDIVVKAPAGTHPLKRWNLDDNDWQLANECPAPILLVRPRPWAKPARFAAAVDVSDKDNTELARSILHTSGFLALGCSGALDILYSERERDDDALRMENAVKLAQLVREFHVGCEHIEVLSGAPEQTLLPLVAARRYDVLVLGAQSRQPMIKTVFGSMTERMFEVGDGDVVLVKAPGHGVTREMQLASSDREQRFHEAQELV